MCEKEDFDIKAARRALGVNIGFLKADATKLHAMPARKTPPDVVRGLGAVETPCFAARKLMTELDPCFAKSSVLKPADLDLRPSVVNPNPDGRDWPTYQAGRMAMATGGYWFGGAIAGDPKIAEVSRLAPAPQLGSSRTTLAVQLTYGYVNARGARLNNSSPQPP